MTEPILGASTRRLTALRTTLAKVANVVHELGSFVDQSDTSDESSAVALGGRLCAPLLMSMTFSASAMRRHVLPER